jgi:hypothetical protein
MFVYTSSACTNPVNAPKSWSDISIHRIGLGMSPLERIVVPHAQSHLAMPRILSCRWSLGCDRSR